MNMNKTKMQQTIDGVVAQMADDMIFSKAASKEEWQQENETQPFAMFAREEGARDYSDMVAEFLAQEEKYTTTHRFFIKLAGRIYGFDLEGPGDPYSPYCYGINLDRGAEPVVESICSLKCYPMMVEDWLTYYHKVGFDRGDAVHGIEPMVLKSSKSERGVEADLKKMSDYHDQWNAECETDWIGKWGSEGYREWSKVKSAEFKALVEDMASKAKLKS